MVKLSHPFHMYLALILHIRQQDLHLQANADQAVSIFSGQFLHSIDVGQKHLNIYIYVDVVLNGLSVRPIKTYLVSCYSFSRAWVSYIINNT